MRIKSLIATLAILAVIAIPQFARAESNSDSGAGILSAAADLDFRIIVPRFLFFRVGTAGAGNVDEIQFDLTGSVGILGDGTDISATAGGDAGVGQVNVVVLSNAGQITITETNNGGGSGLSDGGTNNISYAELLTSSNAGTLAAPTLSDAGGNTSTPTLTAGNVTVRSAVWTYSYDNTAVYEAATYTGTATYTATSP